MHMHARMRSFRCMTRWTHVHGLDTHVCTHVYTQLGGMAATSYDKLGNIATSSATSYFDRLFSTRGKAKRFFLQARTHALGADGTHAHMVQPSASSSQRKYERARTSACHNRTCVHACAHAAIHSPGTLSFGRNICGETCMQHACLRVRTCVCRQVLCHQLKQGRRLGNKTGWPVVARVGLRRTAPADANRF